MESGSERLRVLLVDADDARAAIVEQGLLQSGACEILRVTSGVDLYGAMQRLDPDVVIIDCESPDRDTLESMSEVSGDRARAVVMFVEQDTPDGARRAIQAGVSAYVVDGLSTARVRPIVDVAIARSQIYQGLQKELEKARSDLAGRKVVERAKGFLMQQRGLSEEDAYRLLRRTAMNEGKPILQIADNILAVARLLKG
ncbi:ANTAR domain-containing response regulator [Tepidicaulis sp. LMO-SS28]|uniref:ANTAR domain-containing response regulator n=1 Tax=Tepidicaulis sp. LMO-SS28 TaxID=3447455 RepID=UPI003EE01E02